MLHILYFIHIQHNVFKTPQKPVDIRFTTHSGNYIHIMLFAHIFIYYLPQGTRKMYFYISLYKLYNIERNAKIIGLRATGC